MSSSFKLLAFSFLATAVFAEDAKPKAPDAETMKRGLAVYSRTCIACHQPNGAGMQPGGTPLFPPLAGSEWVSKDASIAVRNIVNGMMGPVTVKGVTYNSMMPPVAGLSDKDIADVVTYVNNTWGNAGPSVTEDEVKAIKKKYADRKTMWTAAEYEKEAKEAPAKK
jgi:nitrite reductase (NO-forming)